MCTVGSSIRERTRWPSHWRQVALFFLAGVERQVGFSSSMPSICLVMIQIDEGALLIGEPQNSEKSYAKLTVFS